jgi:hypothetical protein
MVLALSACGSRPSSSATADRQPATTTATEPAACHSDQAMGRPCPSGEQRSATEESEEYGTGGQHRGDAYSGELYEQCRPFLERSFSAYKACLRY